MARPVPTLTVALAMVVAAGVALAGAGQPAAQRDHPDNLKALLETIQRTIHVQKNAAGGAAMFRALIPDEARLRKALKTGVDPAIVQQALQFYQQITPADEQAGALVKPTQTIVRIHGATTENIGLRDSASSGREWTSRLPNRAPQSRRTPRVARV